jgi:ParB family chromosome partitioning protein
MTARQSLGRGFDALIPTDLDQGMLEEDKNRVQNLLITDIYPNPQQPRREFDQSSLGELARSIKSHGVMHPS